MKSIEIQGKNFLQLSANKNGQIDCPFCNEMHKHGKGDGHRIAHCTTRLIRNPVFFDGKHHYKSDGYVIKYS